MPIKPTTNPLITKIKVGISTDAAKNKIDKHGTKALVVSGRDAYMVIQIGEAMKEVSMSHEGTKYNIIDDFGLIMKASAVWFFKWFLNKPNLQQAVNKEADSYGI